MSRTSRISVRLAVAAPAALASACSLLISPDDLGEGATGSDSGEDAADVGVAVDGPPAADVAPAVDSGGDAGPTSVYAAAVLADAPRAYWRLGEATTAVRARDETGRHDGTFSGSPTLGVTGALVNETTNAAMRFSGTAFIDIGTTLDLDLGAAFAMEAWVDPDRVVADDGGTAYTERYIVSKLGYAGATISGYHLYTNSSSALEIDVCPVPGDGGRCVNYSTAAPLTGTWTYVVVSSDGQNVTWFMNAVSVKTLPFVAAPDPSPSPFRIGVDAPSTTKGLFKGALDEIAIYDHALTSAQVRAHFTASGR